MTITKKTLPALLLSLLCHTAYAQSDDVLTLLFETRPGHGSFKGTDEELQALSSEHRDANGDGVPDLILRREDDDGNRTALMAVDAATRQTIWTLDLTGRDVGAFWGFYTLMAEGEKQRVAVFGGEGFSIFRPDFGAGVWIEFEPGNPDYPLLGVVDVNGDGSDDFIVGNRQTRTVAIWGWQEAGAARP